MTICYFMRCLGIYDLLSLGIIYFILYVIETYTILFYGVKLVIISIV